MTTTGALNAEGIAQGIICMWSGNENNIPSGWILCNGTPYEGFPVPDLRSRFIVCAGKGEGYDEAHTKGEASKHEHTISLISFPALWGDNPVTIPTLAFKTDEATTEFRPKWYALCYIMYVGI